MNNLCEYFQYSSQFYYALIDKNKHFLYVNPLFKTLLNHLSPEHSMPSFSDIVADSEKEKIHAVLVTCLQKPGEIVRADLRMVMKENMPVKTSWELMALPDNESDRQKVQAIGVIIKHPENTKKNIDPVIAKETSERYKAFEQSAEGLWMFETTEPVLLTDPPLAIIEYWKKNSHLVECNDNLAMMYGFEKAEELIGVPLDQLVDFSDPIHLNNLKEFIIKGFQTTTVETKEFDKNGEIKYFVNRMTGVVENGKLKRVWGTQQDITKQRLAEQQLLKSELFYRNLFANSRDGILIIDKEGIVTFASPSITPVLGYESDEILGENTFDYVHPQERSLAYSAFREEMADISTQKFISVRLLRKDGNWMWCIIRGHNLLQNPYVKGLVVHLYDDTKRKETEDALVESEKRLRNQATVLRNVTDVIVTTDLNRTITSWNHVAEKLSGVTQEEAIGRPYRNVLNTDYSPYTQEQVADIVFGEGIWKGEVSFAGSDGEKKYLLLTISLLYDDDRNKVGLLGVGKDITERKKAEASLQESELFYRNLITHSLDGIVMTGPRGIIQYCSPSAEKISGYSTEGLLGHSIFDFIHPGDTRIAIEAFDMEFRKQSVINYISLRLLHASGEWVWCTVRGHNLFDNPTFNAMAIYFTNDSKRKAIEDKHRESEKRFRNLIHNLKLGIILQDGKGKMIITNQAALDMLGLTESQLLGTTSFDPRWNVIHEDGSNFPGDTHPVPVAIKTQKSVRDVVMGVYRPNTNDRVWLLVNAEPVFNNEGGIINVVCSFADITDQKKLAQKLIDQEIQKQKQVTQATIDAQEKERREIGKELHDNINQHLNTTRLYLEVAKEKATGEVRDMLELAHKNMAGIINEIRHMSQSLVPPTLGDLGLVESVQDLCDSIRLAHTFSIEFQYRHFSEEGIPGNLRLMLFRIIQEKISNIIRHANATVVQIKLQSDAENIFLTVTDNGKGFDLSSIKEGLGLGNIRTRAALFNGKVEITTAPGKGCILSVVVPLSGETGSD